MISKRVCLISPGHLASNPRIVKEADALYEAGFTVKVIAGTNTPRVQSLDETIRRRAPWPVITVNHGRRPTYLALRSRQLCAKKAFACGLGYAKVAQWALSSSTSSLTRAAVAQPADLYIAHYLDALPAAALAARTHSAKLGFDAEDDHLGELSETPENLVELAIRRQIEADFLPDCQHLTASSPGIARVYRERHGISMATILNVFPLSQAPSGPAVDRNDRPLSVYWFSQTIGPGRGLECFIKAMGRMRGGVTLSIRGSDFLGYSGELKRLATTIGVTDAISFLPPAPPDEMAILAAQHDVGLALEPNTPLNRSLCLTNKIFIYLLAGIPLILSDTPAQRELSTELGEAAQVIDLANPDSIVRSLERLTTDGIALARAKSAAKRLAWTKFNWDREKEQFIQCVNRALEDWPAPGLAP
jgi:glycosyltransferase involved in cell wall biosynthesis